MQVCGFKRVVWADFDEHVGDGMGGVRAAREWFCFGGSHPSHKSVARMGHPDFVVGRGRQRLELRCGVGVLPVVEALF